MVTNEFTPEQREWLDALKSGKYEQCKGLLHKAGDGYCCLGVAMDLAGLANDEEDQEDENGVSYFDEEGGDSNVELLPSVTRKLQLNEHSGKIKDEYDFTQEGLPNNTLAELNDLGWTFTQIANLLETQPWLFFENFDKEYSNGNE